MARARASASLCAMDLTTSSSGGNVSVPLTPVFPIWLLHTSSQQRQLFNQGNLAHNRRKQSATHSHISVAVAVAVARPHTEEDVKISTLTLNPEKDSASKKVNLKKARNPCHMTLGHSNGENQPQNSPIILIRWTPPPPSSAK